MSLLGDTALLASLITEVSSRTRRSGTVWVVAGVAGGVGVTDIMWLLVRECEHRRSVRGDVRRWERGVHRTRPDNAVVIDASGSMFGVALATDHDVPGMRWVDLDASEDSYLPSLCEHLPTIEGVRALVGDSRGGAIADDPRVVVACRSLDAPLIMDASRWGERVARCASVIHADAPIVVTHGDLKGIVALSATCTTVSPLYPAITLMSVGKRWEAGLRACVPSSVLRTPIRSGRGLRGLIRALESASAAYAGGAVSSPGELLAIEICHVRHVAPTHPR